MVYDGLRYKEKILIVGVIIFQLILCVLMGAQKKSFFCDEIYSYGLANSEAYTFIDPETAKQYAETGWSTGNILKRICRFRKKCRFLLRRHLKTRRTMCIRPCITAFFMFSAC